MDAFSENLKLFFYILLWLSSLLYYVKNNKGLTLGLVLIILYTAQAVVALPLYNDPYSVNYPFNHVLYYWPFLYLFIMIVISLLPLIHLHEDKINYIEIPSHKVLTILCVFFSTFSIISIIEILPRLQEGIYFMMSSDDEGITELYNEMTALRAERKSFTGSYDLIGIFANLSQVILPLLFFTYLVKRRKEKFIIILLSVALLQSPLQGVANASRLQIFSVLFYISLLYFFFRPYISVSTKRIVRRVSVIVLSFFLMVFMMITIARTTSNRINPLFNIERYFAEGPLNFDIFCMDANGTREGNIVAPFFLRIFGEEALTSEQIQFKYGQMKINNKVFSTYVGDFVLDFGPWISLIIFIILFSLFDLSLHHKKRLRYSQIIIIALVTHFCSGYYQFGFGRVNGNLAFIVMILFAIAFYINNIDTEIVKRIDSDG